MFGHFLVLPGLSAFWRILVRGPPCTFRFVKGYISSSRSAQILPLKCLNFEKCQAETLYCAILNLSPTSSYLKSRSLPNRQPARRYEMARCGTANRCWCWLCEKTRRKIPTAIFLTCPVVVGSNEPAPTKGRTQPPTDWKL